MNRIFSALILTMLLTGTMTLTFEIQPVASESKTWTVDDDGPADFHTIQEAENAATSGDIIYVNNGTYYGSVTASSLTLIGQNRVGTVIDGNGTAGPVISLSGSANVSGFTIRNGDYGIEARTYAIVPVYTGHTIDGNTIVDNRYGGIRLQGVGGNAVTNNLIINNSLFGIHLYNAGNNTLSNNILIGNGYGIDFYANSNDNILRNNNMTDNKYNFGLVLRGETRNWIIGQKPGIVNDVDTSNTVNGKPIYYLVNQNDTLVPSDAGYVWLNNCNNITVSGCSLANNLQGILLIYSSNTLIANSNITGNACGVYLGPMSSNNTIVGNTLRDNVYGIYLGELSSFTKMRSNSISGGFINFGINPGVPMDSVASDLANDVDSSNTVDGKPIIYWVGQHDLQVPTDAGYVMLINSTNIRVEGLNLRHNFQNILVLASNNTVILNNSIANSVYGIDVRSIRYQYNFSQPPVEHISFGTTVRGNTFVDNGVGLRFRSTNSTVSNNTLYRNPLGILLSGTDNSTISGNLILASGVLGNAYGDLYIFYYPEGIWERSRELINLMNCGICVGGDDNVVYNNTVMNSAMGISLFDQLSQRFCNGNLVYHNNLINNLMQAMNPPILGNQWDNGYPSGGNYWSDYNGTDLQSSPYQNETGNDGIGDTPYVIVSARVTNKDRYPLMNPLPWTLTLPFWIKTGIEAGNWMKYYYVIADAPDGTSFPKWMKAEFLKVEKTTATTIVTLHMSDGTEQNQTVTVDVVTDSGTIGSFAGLAIPPNSTTGDFTYVSGNLIAMIAGETIRIYAGAPRTVIYTSFSKYPTKFTYYWDKLTGVMVEASAVSESMTATVKATETNIWQSQPTLTGDLDADGKVDMQDLTIARDAFGSYPGQPRWNPMADTNKDNKVNIIDFAIIAKNFGKAL